MGLFSGNKDRERPSFREIQAAKQEKRDNKNVAKLATAKPVVVKVYRGMLRSKMFAAEANVMVQAGYVIAQQNETKPGMGHQPVLTVTYTRAAS